MIRLKRDKFYHHTTIRLSRDMAQAIKNRAEWNRRTFNAEIRELIIEALRKDKFGKLVDLTERIYDILKRGSGVFGK